LLVLPPCSFGFCLPLYVWEMNWLWISIIGKV
jgi:hypothetical protein